MTRMTIRVDVDGVDPNLTDPHDLAEAMVDDFNGTEAALDRVERIRFVGAEWAP